jgi:hypothetical protein
VRDDWDYERGVSGKGYHVNASLGNAKKAFILKDERNSFESDYLDRTIMTEERHFHDGPEEAVGWYVGDGKNGKNIKWKYEPRA